MKLSENTEKLLEILWVTIEEEDKTGLQKKDVVEDSGDELVQQGLAEWKGNTLSPTPMGKLEAARAIRRQRLGERLLADVLIQEDVLLDDHGCHMEHALFDGIDESICTLLGHPSFCPHGRPIPPGECCRQMRATVGKLITPLSQLHSMQSGDIAYTKMNNQRHLQKLMSMGVLPGVTIKLLHRSPSFVFEAGYSQFAVDEDIAADIYVRLNGL
ncbi:MAG: DtxR family iron dependent repressor [Chloroflexi bacterium]|nr:MAG: DtxR family iron dependent repressor [Chloroflexota bacterium]MBL1197369.1 DtxR family iron dependent repressor [Chloroflexota bacterium]NOH14666.1 metal-dependent transcriptional regulator [Chloroflexota bacterium]